MAEAASRVTAVAALGALYFAWRTVTEARASQLGVVLSDLAADLNAGSYASGRILQARARVFWVTAGGNLGENVRLAMTEGIGQATASAVAEYAEAGVADLLTGLGDYLRGD
jgi:hypothetical protein